MEKRLFAFCFVSIILLIFLSISPSLAADEEALARQAEQEGKLRQALTHYVSALQSTSEASSKDQLLREKIIRLAQQIQPPPAVPEEAERHMARGEAAVEAATNERGYIRAASEFKRALRIAPWLPNGYYNLGVVLDKAGKYDEAIKNLKLYLIAVPDAKDAKKLMYKIEYRKEEAKRAKREERQREEIQRRTKAKIDGLSGWWRVHRLHNMYDIPTRSARWSHHGESAIVSVQNNRIEVRVQFIDGSIKIYNGTISGNQIQGQMRSLAFKDCPPFSNDFEGTIWLEEKEILIIAHGMAHFVYSKAVQDLVCRTDINFKYGSSYLLKR